MGVHTICLILIFMITAEIHAHSLANFYGQIICGQTHEFEIHASASNLTICYRKKQIDVNF